MDTKNLITYMDTVGRIILAENIPEITERDIFVKGTNKDFLVVKNPVVVNIVFQRGQDGQSTGQMALQLLPLFFKEFLADKSADVVYTIPRGMICTTDPLVFDVRVIEQYKSIFSGFMGMIKPNSPVDGKDSKVIKLFDD
jgi:hypothetical protein